MTEEENKRQYESYITSAITCGALDAIISYEEWLQTIRSYTPEEVMAGTEKVRTYKEWGSIVTELGIDW